MSIRLLPDADQWPQKLRHVSDWLIRYCLPIGWLALLTGMFWVGERPRYHKLYYASLFFPTAMALSLYPYRVSRLLGNPLILLSIGFMSYTVISALWSGTGASPFSMHLLYVLFLLLATCLMEIEAPGHLEDVTKVAALVATLAAILSLAYYFYLGNSSRLPGYGALYNPLLTGHVFGTFAAYWLARWSLEKKATAIVPMLSFIVLWVVLMFTGSRTPLLALCACLVWLALLSWKRRFLVFTLATVLIAFILYSIFHLEGLFGRGMSYRPAIWAEAIRQIREHIWFGHGYSYPQVFLVDGISDFCCADPHNIELAVLFTGGIVGLALWLSMYLMAFLYSWRNRAMPAVVIASTLLVFGFVSGLTEGKAFISRPKEHWFLIWIPFALLAAVWVGQKHKSEYRDESTQID